MPKGVFHEWTAEELNEVMNCSGVEDHAALAERLGMKPNTIYSVRSKLRMMGSIEEFLRVQSLRGEPLRPRRPETLGEQLARVYKISLGSAGRDGTPQYSVTIPSRVAEVFVDTYGQMVRFELREEGILIVPVPPPSEPELPSWLRKKSSEGGETHGLSTEAG